MIFAAMAAPLAWLLAAAAAAVAIWLFLLKVRPPRVTVPSLLLWARVLRDRREQTIWERIRRAVSLALTALIAVALAFAFTRPSPAVRVDRSGAPTSARVLVVIDSSWSMLARTRSGETRWQRAIAEARRLAAAAGGVPVAVATTADGLVQGPTTDGTLIETALDRIAPAGGAGSAWPRLSGADVHFVTDGAIARPLDRDVVIHSVYEAAPNAGITAFDSRRALDDSGADEAYLEVVNFGQGQAVRLVVTRGDARLLDRRIDMGSGEAFHQVLRLPRDGASSLRARIEASKDALAIDNDAFASIPSPLAIAVVGDRTEWLAPWFAANPGLRATFVSPAAYRPGAEDVVIFDRSAPAAPPDKPALYFAPPAAAWAGTPSNQIEPRPEWTAAGSHPVLDGVDPLTLSIERAHAYQSPLEPIARSVKGTPIVFAGGAAGRPRSVVLAFSPADSNLASAAAFPVLMGNAIEWLGHPASIMSRRAGRAALDPAIVRVEGPDGTAVTLLPFPEESVGLFAEPGLYTAEAAGVRSTFAVNIADPDVSNLSRTTIDAARPALAVTAGITPRPWWIYLAVLAFTGLLLEWWTWLRRITL
jgi:hypothetical protein